jgi:hypothetical protein
MREGVVIAVPSVALHPVLYRVASIPNDGRELPLLQPLPLPSREAFDFKRDAV